MLDWAVKAGLDKREVDGGGWGFDFVLEKVLGKDLKSSGVSV